MKKILISLKVQSTSDIITNSSSEVYSIKTDTDVIIVRSLWDQILLSEYGFEKDRLEDSTISGKIYRDEETGNIILDYSIMCNVDNVETKLKEIFGEDNVKEIFWGDPNYPVEKEETDPYLLELIDKIIPQ